MIKSPVFRRVALAAAAVTAVAFIAIADTPASLNSNLKSGKVQLQSAGALAFGTRRHSLRRRLARRRRRRHRHQ